MTENPFHPLIRCHIPDCDTLCDLKIRKLASTGCQMSGHLPGWLSKFIRIGNITDGVANPVRQRKFIRIGNITDGVANPVRQ